MNLLKCLNGSYLDVVVSFAFVGRTWDTTIRFEQYVSKLERKFK